MSPGWAVKIRVVWDNMLGADKADTGTLFQYSKPLGV